MTQFSADPRPTTASDALPAPRLIALDWGTTSCRAYLLGPDGLVIETRSKGKGILQLSADPATKDAEFAAELARLCGDWIHEAPHLPLLACGMIGSNQGWAEAGYAPLPSRIMAKGPALTPVETRQGILHIVPGLVKDAGADDHGLPDVIRGEETQLRGILSGKESPASSIIVLPGTHTKWVLLDEDEVLDFTTSMTGELYSLLIHHSILGRHSIPPRHPDEAAFLRGVDVGIGTESQEEGRPGLLTALFSARSLAMTNDLTADAVQDYVSGLLIGSEVAGFTRRWVGRTSTQEPPRPSITICANPSLASRYKRAFLCLGIRVNTAADDTTAKGLWHTAVLSGLLAKEKA